MVTGSTSGRVNSCEVSPKVGCSPCVKTFNLSLVWKKADAFKINADDDDELSHNVINMYPKHFFTGYGEDIQILYGSMDNRIRIIPDMVWIVDTHGMDTPITDCS